MTLVKSWRSRSGCYDTFLRKWLSLDKKISFSSSFWGVIYDWFSVSVLKARLFYRRNKRSDFSTSFSMLFVFLCITRDVFRCAFLNVLELLLSVCTKFLSSTVWFDRSYNFFETSLVKVSSDLFLTRPVIKWEWSLILSYYADSMYS